MASPDARQEHGREHTRATLSIDTLPLSEMSGNWAIKAASLGAEAASLCTLQDSSRTDPICGLAHAPRSD